MSPGSIYAWTSIGRPLDPAYPTNRAVMWAMLVAATVYAAREIVVDGLTMGVLTGAMLTALSALVGWALVRELAPDDQSTAFVALAGAVVAYLVVPAASLLVAFTTLLIVRIVNRTVGLPARIADSVIVCLMLGAVIVTGGPVSVGVAGSVAFALDAWLEPRLGHQWLFALAAAVGTATAVAWQGLEFASPGWIGGRVFSVLSVALALFVWRITRTRGVEAEGDATGVRLSAARVRGGMWVALVLVAPTLLGGPAAVRTSLLVWCAVGALAAASLRRGVSGAAV